MINYIKTAFTKPKEIYTGRNMRNSRYFFLLLLMTVVLTFLSLFEFFPAARSMNEDINEIKESIPAFELVEDELESDTESFIYQTDTFLMYFDPQDKISTETIDRNMNTNAIPVSVGLLNDRIYINLIGQNYSLQYADIDNLTTEELETLIASFGNVSAGLVGFFILFLFIFNLFFFLSQLFPITLFANLISVYRKTNLRFFQSAKIALLAIMAPTITVSIINAFLFPVRFQFEIIMVASLVIYYMSMTEFKKRLEDQIDSE